MEWLKQKMDTLDFHLRHPAVDTDRYIQSRRLNLGCDIASRHRIYLDTKQWLQMRDVLMGRPRNTTHTEILERLRTLKSAGKIICPVSYSVFVELMSQSDETTRLATARIIDQLADGCCCIPPHVLAERELMYFMIEKACGGQPKQPPILHTVWTKISYVLGESVPRSSAFAPEVTGPMQRAFDDLMCQISVEEMIAQLGTARWHDDIQDRQKLVVELDEGKRRHASDHANFHELLCEEVCGGLDALGEMLEETMVQVSRLSGISGPVPDAERQSGGKMLANLVAAAFRSRKICSELPQIHIHAALHAAVRWDKARKYEVNDLEDFRHACVALPYYDVFCTERSLRHLVCQKALCLDKVYNTKIIVTDEEFLAHVVALAAA